MRSSAILDALMHALPTVTEHHAPSSPLYSLLKPVARREIESLFKDAPEGRISLSPFGDIALPYHSMGAINSLNLFDLDELIIFSFYWANRHRYARVLDLGANLGLHSIMLSKCGYDVRSYEPDPVHYEILQRNLKLNGIKNVQAHNAAVSVEEGTMEFVRVLGNTTSSHLAGSKPNPYGELERFPVRLEAIGPLLGSADLMKMDIEGHEKKIILSTNRADWERLDALVEIQNPQNAREVYNHLHGMGVGMFSQNKNWMRVKSADDMPTSYRDGTLFISAQRDSVWG